MLKKNIFVDCLFVFPFPYICNMKFRNILIAGVLLGVGYYFYRKKTLGDNARFSFDAIKLSGTNIIVTLGVLNSTSASATLKSIVGDLLINENIIATASTFVPVNILPNQKTQFNLTFVPNASGVLTSLKSVIKTGIKNVKAKFVGNANVNGLNIPLDIKYGL